MKVRGHHLVCTYCFYGSGKKTARDFFGIDNAIPELLRKLRENPDLEITVMADFDDVCGMCPIKTPEGCGRGKGDEGGISDQNEKLRQWDRILLDRLGLRVGEEITARNLEKRLGERIPDIGRICTNCTSASPSGFAEYRRAIEKGLWPGIDIPDDAC
ncbi:MAG: DUF1284 domain-containing protein [Phycisphaerae bacterium]|nr:DUF1284 domain-containing protein [Phycisphaerae bacterium]